MLKTFSRLKIQELLATKKKRINFESQISFEEETLSAGSESGVLDEYSLIVPKDNELAEFESDLIVLSYPYLNISC